MPREITANLRTELEASRSGEFLVFFAEITHPDLIEPYRFNSDLVDYVYEGETWLGAGFEVSLMSDDESPARARVSIHNVDQAIGEAIRAIATSPRIDMKVCAQSDFSDANPRVEIGTPVVEYSAPYLELRNVKCDAQFITGDLVGPDLTAEPWPSIRSTKDKLPGLFR
jgi:hypothetical protein